MEIINSAKNKKWMEMGFETSVNDMINNPAVEWYY